MTRTPIVFLILGLVPSALYVVHAFYPLETTLGDLLFGASCIVAVAAVALVLSARPFRNFLMIAAVVAPAVIAGVSSPIRLAVVRRVIARGQPVVNQLRHFEATAGRPAASIEEAVTNPPKTSVPAEPTFKYEQKGGSWRLFVVLPARSGAILEYPVASCSGLYRYCRDGWGYVEE